MRKMQKAVEGKHFSLPQQPDLPDERVSDDPPFTHTGIDLAGPLYTSEKGANEKDSKTYVCLFTCASTGAVHPELTKRLSSEAFMLAFRRSTSRRGLPLALLSDNARTFKSPSKDIVRIAELKKLPIIWPIMVLQTADQSSNRFKYRFADWSGAPIYIHFIYRGWHVIVIDD